VDVADDRFKSRLVSACFLDIDVMRAHIGRGRAVFCILVSIQRNFDVSNLSTTGMHAAVEQVDVAEELVDER
jgi:hypothetical protein